MRAKLTKDEIQTQLDNLNTDSAAHWIVDNGKLFKQFEFSNFISAMGFMMQSAMVAEKMNHHPEWSNVYKKVSVHLVTHSSDGITELDFDLAMKMQSIAQQQA